VRPSERVSLLMMDAEGAGAGGERNPSFARREPERREPERRDPFPPREREPEPVGPRGAGTSQAETARAPRAGGAEGGRTLGRIVRADAPFVLRRAGESRAISDVEANTITLRAGDELATEAGRVEAEVGEARIVVEPRSNATLDPDDTRTPL